MGDRVSDWLDQRWTVNLSILFTDLPLTGRPAAAAALGFDAAELWWTLDGPTPPSAELDALRRAFTDAGVQLTGLNFDAGNMAGGDKGLVCRPADRQRFRDNIAVAVGLADSLGCRALNALYGNRPADVPVSAQDQLALENLVLESPRTGLVLDGATDLTVTAVTVASAGSWGVTATNVTGTLDGLTIVEPAAGGIQVSGGMVGAEVASPRSGGNAGRWPSRGTDVKQLVA